MCIISLAVVNSLEIQEAEGKEALLECNNFSAAFRYANCCVDQMSSAKGIYLS